MGHRIRIFLLSAIAMAFLAPDVMAQKPPAPTPAPPPSAPPNRPTIPTQPTPGSTQPGEDFVMFLRGRVAIHDGGSIPNDVLIERVCNNRVRQNTYASLQGDFSMQLGSRTDSFPEASADSTSSSGSSSRSSDMGIPRHELTNCDLRVSASGFRSSVVNLLDVDNFGSNVDVGVIVVRRATKVEGTTISATPYKAPTDARKAYEKGLDAERRGKLADAQKYFDTAVQLYPSFTNAWFQLGRVFQKQKQNDAAREAYTHATTIDTKYLPPYLFLAEMAFEAANWTEVLKFTGHLLDLDPLNQGQGEVTAYVMDLDPLNYAEAYFYNAMANYSLNKIEDAEKSALKAEHFDLRTHFPQLHLLLAEIFARKNKYDLAIAELQTYLALAPQANDAAQQRETLAKLEKLNNPVPTAEKPEQR
jgi:Tetratricopeptide repeat